MTTAAILVPWRAGDPTREEGWRRVQAHLTTFDMPVYIGDSDPSKPFNRSQARNRAAEQAGDVDVLVFMDADHVTPREQVEAAVRRATMPRGGTGVHAYDSVEVVSILTGEHWPVPFTEAHTSGNIVVPRHLYEETGGWDERFVTWGYEDSAFAGMVIRLTNRPIARIHGPSITYEHNRAPDEQYRPDVKPPRLFFDYMRLFDRRDALIMAREVRAARLR